MIDRDCLARFAIALRYASPPDGAAPLAEWVEYTERALDDAQHRGIKIIISRGPVNDT